MENLPSAATKIDTNMQNHMKVFIQNEERFNSFKMKKGPILSYKGYTN